MMSVCHVISVSQMKVVRRLAQVALRASHWSAGSYQLQDKGTVRTLLAI